MTITVSLQLLYHIPLDLKIKKVIPTLSITDGVGIIMNINFKGRLNTLHPFVIEDHSNNLQLVLKGFPTIFTDCWGLNK